MHMALFCLNDILHYILMHSQKFLNMIYNYSMAPNNRNIHFGILDLLFSHTSSGFQLFIPMWDKTHIPVPAGGKDKIRTAARRPHAGRTSIRDVIVMLKIRHHVATNNSYCTNTPSNII